MAFRMRQDVGQAFENDPQLSQFILRDVTPTGRILGTGSYGSVEEVSYKHLVCAGKKLHEALIDVENEGMAEIVHKYLQECQLMSSLRHPNITQFLGLCFLPGTQLPLLVMECLETSLDDLLEHMPDFPLSLKRSVLEDVARGLFYLHDRDPPVIHRDLTSRNILLTSSLVAKITDLGNSRIVGPGQMARTLSKLPGTAAYMPPEAQDDISHYGPSLDIFSFGHLALYTVTQKFPGSLLPATYLNPHNNLEVIGRTEIERRGVYIELLESRVYTTFYPSLVELVKQCLQNDPNERPSTDELLTRLQEMRREIEGQYLGSHPIKLDMVRVRLAKEVREKARRMEELTQLQGRQEAEVEALRRHVQELQTECRSKERQIQLLQDRVAATGELERHVEELQAEVQSKNEQITSKNSLIARKEEEIASKEDFRRQVLRHIEDLQAELTTKNEQIMANNNLIAMKDREIATKEDSRQQILAEVQAKNEQITAKNCLIARKDREIATKEGSSKQLQRHVEELQAEVQAKNEQITAKNTLIARKDREIATNEGSNRQLQRHVEDLQAEVQAKNEEITAKNSLIARRERDIASKEDSMRQMLGRIETLQAEVQGKNQQITAMNSRIAMKDNETATKDDAQLKLLVMKEQTAANNGPMVRKGGETAAKFRLRRATDSQLQEFGVHEDRMRMELATQVAEMARPREAMRKSQGRITKKESLTLPLRLTWSHYRNLPYSMTSYVQSVVIQGRLFVGGGDVGVIDTDSAKTVMEYDISSGNWTILPLYRACGFAMAVINNQMVLVGGEENDGDSKVLGVWRSNTQTWSQPYPEMPTARSHCSVVVFNEWLVVAGGWAHTERLSCVEVLNSNTRQWFTGPPTPIPWDRMKTAVVGEMGYFMGGWDNTRFASMKVYSVDISNLLSHITNSRASRQIWKEISGLNLACSAPLSICGYLLAVGGKDKDRNAVTAMHLYQPDSGAWVKVGDLPSPRYDCTCVITEDQKLVIAGGTSRVQRPEIVDVAKFA